MLLRFLRGLTLKPPRAGVNRRDLLRLRRLSADMAAPMPSPGTSLAQSPPMGGWADLIRVHRPAMGSFFEVRLGARVPGALELASRALDLIDELEAQLTVYRDDSEVSRLNATAHWATDRGRTAICSVCSSGPIELSRQTGGAYDVTSGALSEAWGFVRGPKRVPDRGDAWPMPGPGPAGITFGSTREAKTVGFDRPGIRINLGSSARATRSIGRSKSFAITGFRLRRWFTAASPACSPWARHPAGSAAAGKSPFEIPFRAGDAAGCASPAKPRPGHLGRRVSAFRGGGPGLRPYHRSADR